VDAVDDEEYGRMEGAFQRSLDDSLIPRAPDSLFDLVGSLEVPEKVLAVNIGCVTAKMRSSSRDALGCALSGSTPRQATSGGRLEVPPALRWGVDRQRRTVHAHCALSSQPAYEHAPEWRRPHRDRTPA